MDFVAEAKRIIDIEIQALHELKKQIDRRFETAVKWIIETLNNQKKIVITGIGKSGHIGRKIAATLTSTGATSVVLDPVEALHGDLGIINDGDLIIILSYSGESEEILNLLPILKRFEVRIIAITGNCGSSVAKYADLIIPVRVRKEACPFNLAPTSSSTAMLVLGDAIAMTAMKARGVKRTDFAKLHPAGAIGRSLLLRACDIMRTGERLPIASPSLPVKDALLVMTKAQAGCVIIVRPSGKLAGIFTDGDLRRHLSTDPVLLSKPLKAVMTPNPISVRYDALVVEVLRIFKEKKIDDLIVIDKKGHVVGLIDSQDLPKLKLM